jgi:hypothetical protein
MSLYFAPESRKSYACRIASGVGPMECPRSQPSTVAARFVRRAAISSGEKFCVWAKRAEVQIKSERLREGFSSCSSPDLICEVYRRTAISVSR